MALRESLDDFLKSRAMFATAAALVAAGGVSMIRALGVRRAALVSSGITATMVAGALLQERRLRGVAATLDRRTSRSYREAEHLVRLSAVLGGASPIPALREGAISPDLGVALVRLIQRERPRLIVELGPGSSTVIMASAIRDCGLECRIVSFEHDAAYATRVDDLLADYGLTDVVDLRLAPLEPFPGESGVEWYRTASFADLHGVDLLFIDGPPAYVPGTDGSRSPALPFLVPSLSPGALIVLDDASRPGEQAAIATWQQQVDGLTVESAPDTEKGAAIFRLGGDAGR